MYKTVDEVIEAIKKNGYVWARLDWGTEYGAIKEFHACVLGQAAVNLDCTWQSLSSALSHLDNPYNLYYDLSGEITRYNDAVAKSYEEAANFAIQKLEKYRGRKLNLRTRKGTKYFRAQEFINNDS